MSCKIHILPYLFSYIDKMDSFKLRSVKKSDCLFLYELLKERKITTNISHKKMPSFIQHEKFVVSKPYLKWYVINECEKDMGSIYLTKNNEIGLFILKKYQNKKLGFKALTLMIKKHPKSQYLANINPKNRKSIQFFKQNGFKLIQYTYVLNKNS